MRLNASFASVFPKPGRIGFVAQSGAVITAVLDWAHPRDIGFSHVVSLGDMADVDFGDMLDYLANDEGTDAVLLYIEAVTDARKFLSAARGLARTKPVVVVKAGRFEAGARAAASHTGALAGMDAVYDAAFRRAGMLRVLSLEELFDVVETLATANVPRGEALTILTNGGGLGVLAADALMAEGGSLTVLSDDTIARLSEVLPVTWSHGNPIDIIGDATGARYAVALNILLESPEVDALLVLNCPTALASSDEVATAIMDTLAEVEDKTVLTSWTGEHSTRAPRARLQAEGIPTYDTPEDAVHAFVQMVDYRRNQQLLLQAPPSLPELFEPDRAAAQVAIEQALSGGREWLAETEAKEVLAAYGIETVTTLVAESLGAVGSAARGIGGPVVIKILSPDIIHKSDVGGVLLDVDAAQAEAAAAAMLERVRAKRPNATIQGFTVQAMVRRPGAHELIVGMIDDRQFGPVILFGHGGTAVEVLDDKALALPPLNLKLARDLMSRTEIYKLLCGFRDTPAADLEAIEMTLVRLSYLIADLPTVQELDINPLLADAAGVIALDARIRVASAHGVDADRLAIRPYPKQLEAEVTDKEHQRFFLRPIVPEDEPQLRRSFGLLPEFAAARLTQIDYDRQMALVLSDHGIPGTQPIYGIVRLLEDPDRTMAEVNIAVAAELTERGLGSLLLGKAIEYARRRGIAQLLGEIDADDEPRAKLYAALGFVPLESSSDRRSFNLTLR
jgi:acetyltransferase